MGTLKTAAPPKPGSRRRDFRSGEVIDDRYQLVRPLGEGGMGVVWVAQSLMLDVPVAIKLLHVDLSGTAVAERMSREAKAAAKLGHPAIARVLDFGKTADGFPYMAMELLHGDSLADALDQTTRISATKAVQMLLPICDGLATAHDKGIVHRDLKPDNIFLAKDEVGRIQPKLLDFGIAKTELDDIDRKLTQEGTLLGSPDYMSPEQAYGLDDIDHHSDIWQFCVVLYEAITGCVPFTGKNYNALLRSITMDDPPPITEFAAGNTDLWRVLERGLKKDKFQRWSSMWELGEALALWLYEQGVREDICANSLRKSWLESGISGVQVDLDSEAPPPELPTEPPPAPPTSARVPKLGGATLDGTDTTALVPDRRRRWLLPLVALVALAGIGGVGFVMFRPGTTAPADTPGAAAAAGPETDVPKPVETAPAPDPAGEVSGDAGAKEAELIDEPGEPTTKKPVQRRGTGSWRPPAKAKPAPAPAPTPAPVPKPKGERDFGF